MKDSNIITNHCIIRNHSVSLNGKEDYHNDTHAHFPDFIKSVYNHYQTDYAKFFKMDNLSKLGFITGEILLNKKDLSIYPNEDIGMVIANSSSCLDTDEKYYDTIKDNQNYFPSPSVFVYTLPNIMIGELCIKHHIKGENSFFVFDSFDIEFLCNYVNSLLDSDKIKTCIAGWVDVYHEQYESILFLIEKNTEDHDGIKCTVENIKNLYLNKNKK